MKKIKLILIALLILNMSSCFREPKYPEGHFSEELTNLTQVNSEYDDYNSTLRMSFSDVDLCFSTNRRSQGGNFDLIEFEMTTAWYQKSGRLTVDFSDGIYKDLVNTEYNELGPYYFFIPPYLSLMLYANDSAGNYDIKFLLEEQITDVKFLNSEANDMYPSFWGANISLGNGYQKYVNKVDKIIYCSDRNGNFDIFEVAIPANSNILEVLQSDTPYQSVKMDISSPYDDKCPYVEGSLLVFASNRPGGYGGFDLYYSTYSNGRWSEPVNFGPDINSPYDEYRPIVHYQEKGFNGFDNNLLIFSSNRPGGLGGYDLYSIGIPATIKMY